MDQPGDLMQYAPATTPGTGLVLATDLDGTFAGGTPAERRALQAALRAAPDALLLYVTGRSAAATRELMDEADLPHPDVLVCDVGTSVLAGPDLVPVAAVEAALDSLWPGAEAVRDRLEGLAGIEEQEIRAPRRVSYWLREGAMDEVLAEMAERLEGLPVELVGSAGVYLDVLPAGVNKGTTLRRVLRWLGRPEAEVVVAGDSLNDLALFETGLRGVVVGNCEPALRERLGERAHLYHATGHGAAGILEGLHHFGCVTAMGGEDGE
jgi:sucrose-6F-phosphate phosphohydrolase